MKHHILSIGITKYQKPEANNLQFATKDAQEFYNLFIENIPSIGYKKLLVDNEATLSQIRTALGKELRSEVQQEDTLFIFFSGHGDTDMSDGEKAHFLVPFDATDDISNTGISVIFLKDALDTIKCKAKFVFIDSCFSGSVNSKHFPRPATKDFSQTTKTIINTVSGVGEIVFTASKETEESIEDPENKNGLFTYFLLQELQKDTGKDKIPIESIFTPISEAVSKRAKEKYSWVQTPTMGGRIEGGLYLPPFRKKITYKPEFIAVPPISRSGPVSVPILEIQISNKEQQKIINEITELVMNTNSGKNPKYEKIIFERFCFSMLKQAKEEWEQISNGVGGDANKIPDAVAKLEAACFQFILFGNVVAIFGSQQQMSIFARCVSEILNWGEGKAGFIALISTPEIIVAEIISSIGVSCLANEDIAPLKTLLYTDVEQNSGKRPTKIFMHEGIFYCDALGGNSTIVNEHLREVLKSYQWLTDLVPRLEGKIEDFQLQLNFILVILSVLNDGRLWAEFGRFDPSRIMPLIQKLKYNISFSEQLANLWGVDKGKAREAAIKAFKEVTEQWRTGGRHWWESINVEDFLTEEELEELKKQQTVSTTN